MITKFMQDEEGATAIEYGLIAALIAVVIITALIAVGNSLSTTFTTIESGKGGHNYSYIGFAVIYATQCLMVILHHLS